MAAGSWLVLRFVLLGGFAILAVDVGTPLGLAAGLLYVVPLVLLRALESPAYFRAAGVYSLFVGVGMYFAPSQPSVPHWMVAYNRIFSVTVIWLCAALLAQRYRYGHTALSLSTGLRERHEAERRRMAMDVHDSLGQISAGLSLLLHNHRAMVGHILEEHYLKTVDAAIALASSLTGEVRNLAVRLYPITLERNGLESAIRRHADHLSGLTDILIEVSHSYPRRLSRDLELNLFRVAQESLTNVIKHSSATHAWVSLDRSDSEVVLSVRDDGVGMPQHIVENFNEGQGPLGFGLSGILERVRDQGGSAWIRSSAHGTELTVSIPREEKI